MSEEKDPGSIGGKLSKFDPDKEREKQRVALWNKWFEAQCRWIREYDEKSWEAYRKVSDEYRRQFDH